MAENYWLMKSEPDAYSYGDLANDTANKGSGRWDGVRNYAAAGHLRAMKEGDLCFFYHSRSGLEIVGLMEVATEHYPDPTDEKGKFVCVDVRAVRPLSKPVSLQAIKANPKLSGMAILRQSRLSVSPVSKEEWLEIIRMSEDDS